MSVHDATNGDAMAATYDVTGQREVIDLTNEQGAVKAVEISFATKPSGIVGTVTIPKATYSPDNAARAIEAYAAALESTHAL